MLISRIRPGEEVKKRPTTPFLISLNALLFLGMMAFGANIFGQVIAVIFTLVYVGVCGLWHGTIVLIEKRFVFHPTLRAFLFLSPLFLLLFLPVAPGAVPNQITPLQSPSGEYELRVRSHRYWDLEIRDLRTFERQLFETEFPGHYPIYWQWDDEDRLWVFAGETWRVYFWELTDGEWQRNEYTPAEHPELEPPDAIFPDYVAR